jgi:hypothetical protein
MARGTSTKLMATLPDKYSSNWLTRLDKRTRIARAVLDRIGALESDAGGEAALSHAKRSLIRRAVWIEALCEGQELRLAAGEAIDVGALTQLTNSLLGVYRMLGLERRQRPVRSLRQIMNGSAPVAPAVGSIARPGRAP